MAKFINPVYIDYDYLRLKKQTIFHTSPPYGDKFNIEYYEEPMFHQMLHKIENIEDLFYVQPHPNSFADIELIINHQHHMLNYSQLYQLWCNAKHILQTFVGSMFTSAGLQQMNSALQQFIHYASQIEIKPGDFGYGIIKPDSITADDFGLEEWE